MAHQSDHSHVFQRLFTSRVVLIVGLVVLVFLGVTLAREVQKSYQINQEIAEIEATVERLERRNEELTGSLQYFRSEAFQEKEARQKLGLQKEGETAVAIPVPAVHEVESSEGQAFSAQVAELINPQRWWRYFFD